MCIALPVDGGAIAPPESYRIENDGAREVYIPNVKADSADGWQVAGADDVVERSASAEVRLTVDPETPKTMAAVLTFNAMSSQFH